VKWGDGVAGFRGLLGSCAGQRNALRAFPAVVVELERCTSRPGRHRPEFDADRAGPTSGDARSACVGRNHVIGWVCSGDHNTAAGEVDGHTPLVGHSHRFRPTGGSDLATAEVQAGRRQTDVRGRSRQVYPLRTYRCAVFERQFSGSGARSGRCEGNACRAGRSRCQLCGRHGASIRLGKIAASGDLSDGYW